MTPEKFIELMEIDNVGKWEGDNAYKGLQIIAKYTDNIVQGAGHDIIYSENIDTLIENGITEEDVIALRELNWMIYECDYLACYV
jgi:hypothetical protein